MTAYGSVSVPATPEGVRRAADAFESFGASQNVPAEIRWRFLVAIDEALSNIVRHGYKGARGEIALSFTLEGRTLKVAVSDSAPMFNPLLAPPSSGVPPERRHGGVGIALVRALMDDVRYEWRDGRNHFEMARALDGQRRRRNADP
jgi:anti-sigma regulatory factor (Ser/Thr protein kinase)